MVRLSAPPVNLVQPGVGARYHPEGFFGYDATVRFSCRLACPLFPESNFFKQARRQWDSHQANLEKRDEEFLDRYKRGARMPGVQVSIAKAWRGFVFRRKFLAWKGRRQWSIKVCVAHSALLSPLLATSDAPPPVCILDTFPSETLFRASYYYLVHGFSFNDVLATAQLFPSLCV